MALVKAMLSRLLFDWAAEEAVGGGGAVPDLADVELDDQRLLLLFK